jgi:hypothetical protein
MELLGAQVFNAIPFAIGHDHIDENEMDPLALDPGRYRRLPSL